jgi:hypothetical protein
LTSPPDQAQIKPLGGRLRRISTTLETQPIVQGELTQADGRAERKAALDMVHRHSPGSTRRLTLGADKGYDAAEFVGSV